jgi:hypothetical protein
MVTIHISTATKAAIKISLPKGTETTPAGVCGGFCLNLDLETIDRLTNLRRAFESYSDVILRLARTRSTASRRQSEARALAPPFNVSPPEAAPTQSTNLGQARSALCSDARQGA